MPLSFILHWCKRVLAHYEISSIEFLSMFRRKKIMKIRHLLCYVSLAGYVIDHKCYSHGRSCHYSLLLYMAHWHNNVLCRPKLLIQDSPLSNSQLCATALSWVNPFPLYSYAVAKVDPETRQTRQYSRLYKIKGSRLLNTRPEESQTHSYPALLEYCEEINTRSCRVTVVNLTKRIEMW